MIYQIEDNITLKLSTEGNALFKRFFDFFFSGISSFDSTANTQLEILTKFVKKPDDSFHSGVKGFYCYRREINNNKITTYISIKKNLSLYIREIYKIAFPEKKIIGLVELYTAIIRTAFLEPLEYYLSHKGWFLIHGSLIKAGTDFFCMAGGSGTGKSTLSKLFTGRSSSMEVLADNYVFLKGREVIAIPEPLRNSNPKRFGLKFYGKRIESPPLIASGQKYCKKIFLLEKSKSKNIAVKKISAKESLKKLKETLDLESEGAYYCKHLASLMPPKDIEIQNKNYLIEIPQGLENIKTASFIINEEVNRGTN